MLLDSLLCIRSDGHLVILKLCFGVRSNDCFDLINWDIYQLTVCFMLIVFRAYELHELGEYVLYKHTRLQYQVSYYHYMTCHSLDGCVCVHLMINELVYTENVCHKILKLTDLTCHCNCFYYTK